MESNPLEPHAPQPTQHHVFAPVDNTAERKTVFDNYINSERKLFFQKKFCTTASNFLFPQYDSQVKLERVVRNSTVYIK